MGRLINIKEPGLVLTLNETSEEISGIDSYTISRQRDSLGVDFSITFPGVVEVTDGAQVSFKDIEGIITSHEIRVTPGGYATIVNCVSIIGELIHKSPKKTLMYMSMTAAEINEFKVNTKEEYDDLDYIPLIKQCDEDSGINGWNCHDVIADLASKAGLTVVVNTYNYWLKQVQASSNSSYFETILSLVSFLKPIIYSDEDNVIYIIERPLMGGSIELVKSMNLSQRSSYSFESKTQYFYVEGGYGKWDRSKSKIHTDPETEVEIVSTVNTETPMLLTINLPVGDPKIIWKIQGREGTKEQPTIQVGKWLTTPMREKHTTSTIWRLDPFGNWKCPISRHKVVYNETIERTTMDSLEEWTYDFLTEEFDKPRLSKKETTIGRYNWRVTEILGLTFRSFSTKVEEISESWIYSDNGLLLQEIMTKKMDVVRLQDGDEYVELDLADSIYIPEGGDALEVTRATVEEVVTDYRQLTPDYYEKSTTRRRLGALARKVGQENYSVTTDPIRGKVPRNPMHFRQSVIWAGDTFGADALDSQDVPTMMMSNPNIIDWQDAEAILGRLKSFATEANLTEREIAIPLDIPIDIGWQIDLLQVPLAGGDVIPAAEVINYTNVASWSKSVRVNPPSSVTNIVVEAR